MIIGKDSAKKGFTWFGITCLKAIVCFATISVGGFMIAVGIVAFLLFAYEQIKEWRRLSN